MNALNSPRFCTGRGLSQELYLQIVTITLDYAVKLDPVRTMTIPCGE